MRIGMMIRFGLVGLVLGLASPAAAPAQTAVFGPITTDTRWTVAGRPYILHGDVEVLAGATLTIETGVRVEGMPGSRLVIGGEGDADPATLRVMGSPSVPNYVTFSGSVRGDPWGGLVFRPGAVATTLDAMGEPVAGSLLRGMAILDARLPITMTRTSILMEDVDVNGSQDPDRAAVLVDLDGVPEGGADALHARRLTVRNAQGVGLHVVDGRGHEFVDCRFIQNGGTGLSVFALPPRTGEPVGVSLTRCEFLHNTGRGTTFFEGGGAMLVAWDHATLTDCLFEGNTSARNAAGLLLFTADASLTRCRFIENTAANSGGGMESEASNTSIDACEFIDNAAGTSAGGLLTTPGIGSAATIVDCRFVGNRAGRGGALTIAADDVLIGRNAFDRNTSTTDGGAIRFIGSAQAVRVEHNRFETNSCAGVGGAVGFVDASAYRDVAFVGNTFTGNLARRGGAIHTTRAGDRGSAFTFAAEGGAFNTFAGNTADLGPAIFHAGPADIDATGVCWGTGVAAAIERFIHDGLDEPGLGIVHVDPIATGCDTCRPDLDGDGVLTLFDFLAFSGLFTLGDPAADFDGDGTLTIFDFLAFQTAFGAGCP